ncbi:uncharacterized protein LOC115629892 [Scaptodrosophila lebanonensis]|uniref:Uncharacterized protein LOC115629892 n=1 Tax=Drosophila lebanonensis TaxID=7225 RepID=A0A6J2U1W1_DROLE|nr:uncharacterized protein LOC115629892 [Scaptodrosophila lebanonensis]
MLGAAAPATVRGPEQYGSHTSVLSGWKPTTKHSLHIERQQSLLVERLSKRQRAPVRTLACVGQAPSQIRTMQGTHRSLDFASPEPANQVFSRSTLSAIHLPSRTYAAYRVRSTFPLPALAKPPASRNRQKNKRPRLLNHILPTGPVTTIAPHVCTRTMQTAIYSY